MQTDTCSPGSEGVAGDSRPLACATETSNDRAPEPLGFLRGGGAMGALMRAIDWSATPLGPAELMMYSETTGVIGASSLMT